MKSPNNMFYRPSSYVHLSNTSLHISRADKNSADIYIRSRGHNTCFRFAQENLAAWLTAAAQIKFVPTCRINDRAGEGFNGGVGVPIVGETAIIAPCECERC